MLRAVKALKLDSLKDLDHIAIICSTFGKGRPPNNATEFFETNLSGRINQNTQYTLLALGSSLYPDFCKAGINIDNKMKDEAGAIPKMNIVCVDMPSEKNEQVIVEWSDQVRKIMLPDSTLESIEANNTRSEKQYDSPTYRIMWQIDCRLNGHFFKHERSDESSLRC